MAVPSASTSIAPSGDTSAAASGPVPKTAGLGKYSPKIIAARSLPAAPRIIPSLRLETG